MLDTVVPTAVIIVALVPGTKYSVSKWTCIRNSRTGYTDTWIPGYKIQETKGDPLIAPPYFMARPGWLLPKRLKWPIFG